MPFSYHRLTGENPSDVFFYGTIRSAGQVIDNSNAGQFFTATAREQGRERGDSVALLVWNREDDQGNPRTIDKYLPETVDTVTSLVERAKLYGIEAQFQEGLTCLRTALAGQKWKLPSPVPIVFAVPRPFHLIGQDSSIELTSYLVEIEPPSLFTDETKHPVRIASQRDMVQVPLLRRMSGDDKKALSPEWVLVGAGSLGSKIALHLARSGRAPRAIIDPGRLSPHNAARHALYPARQGDWLDQKAEALSEAITGLGQSTWPIPEDVGPILRETSRARALFSKRTWATVNATASLAVREAFAAADPHLVRARTIESGLFGRGMLGYIAIEGAERNPNCLDLMAEFYRITGDDPDIAAIVHSIDAGHERLNIGDGCGSVTMPMSDAQLTDRTRDHKKFNLIFEENISYGFRRNSLGLKPVAMAILILSFVAAMGYGYATHRLDIENWPLSIWASIALDLVATAYWILVVAEPWVRDAGDAYAHALLGACDTLSESRA